MSSSLSQTTDPDWLASELRQARAVTSELVLTVMLGACMGRAGLNPAAKAQLGKLIVSGAWVDAALALVELELPRWKLRRIVYDNGEWFCSLAKEPLLPLELDESAEASHETLPLAILMALVAARNAAAEKPPGATTVPQVCPVPGDALCCDNFA